MAQGISVWRSAGIAAIAATLALLGGCAAPTSTTALTRTVQPTAQADADNADIPDLQTALQDNADQAQYADLWQRIRGGYAIPDMDDAQMAPYVQQDQQWYATRPDYVARMTERSRKYLYYIVAEVQRRHLPTELALLPFVESAFNPQAMSPANASGMWQFIPSTGKNYDLKQNMFLDGRRDVMASTRAALDYLTKLHTQFGDWQLALAAYNWGENGVQRAIARNQAQGLPTDYASLRMPAETRNYYPKLQAIKNIIAHPVQYGIALPAIPDHPYFKVVTLQQDIDVSLAARLAGIAPREFRALNPSLNTPVILAAGKPRLLLPFDDAPRFEQALAHYDGPLSSWTTYTVAKTASPETLARQLHVAVSTLRGVNGIPPRKLIRAGSTLLVPKSPEDDSNVSARVVDSAVLALAPELPALRRVSVRAGTADTPQTLARRYGVAAADVARWNHLGAHQRLTKHARVIVYLRRAPAPTRLASSAQPTRVATASAASAHRARHPQRVVASAQRSRSHRPLRHVARRRHLVRVADAR